MATPTLGADILAIKVELGDRQTLGYIDADGNPVLYEIPDYAEQVTRCKQYDADTGEYIGSPRITGGTIDLVAGSSSLPDGDIYLVYE